MRRGIEKEVPFQLFQEQRARKLRLSRLFVLTTRTSGWFLERGFVESDPGRLPKQKRDLYNWQRRSLVYEKSLA